MQSFRFVHAADLHLDAPFRGLSLNSEEIGRKLRQATFKAFENLVDLCLRVQADFLLIAGDVYNQEDRSLRAQLKFFDGLARLSDNGVQVFVVHGNHDPAGTVASAIKWPNLVKIFDSDEPETLFFHKGGEPLALIHGASHLKAKEGRNLAKKFCRNPEDLFQIGLLHCNLGKNTGHEPYAPCDLRDLEAIGLNYWALGHVHSKGIFLRDPYVVYPGNIQGLSILETGERGCYVADVDHNGSVDLSFHALDSVRWTRTELNIRDTSSLDGLEEKIIADMEGLREEAGQRGLICRVVLEGRGQLHSQFSSEAGQEDLLQHLREYFASAEPFVWVKDILVQTRPEVDLKERSKAQDLLGEVLSQAKDLRSRADRGDILNQKVLSDLFEHPRAKKLLKGLSLEEIDEILLQAEYLCLDLLDPGKGE